MSLIPLPTCQNEGCSRRPRPLTKRQAWLKHGYQKGIWLGEMKARQAVRGYLGLFLRPKAEAGADHPRHPTGLGLRYLACHWRVCTRINVSNHPPGTATRSRDIFASGFCVNLAPERMKRAQGRPGDRCTRGPRARKIARRALDHRYRRRHSGLPCAMV